MKIIYFDCFGGISGDMILGALLHAGLDIGQLNKELSKLRLKGCCLRQRKVKRQGLSGMKVNIIQNAKYTARYANLKEITTLIDKSKLDREIKETSKEIFKNLAQAERKAHGVKKEHFHEVGDIDSVVDIVGTVIGLHLLGIEKVYTSPLILGRTYLSPLTLSSVQALRGAEVILPVPAPATISSLIGFPCLLSNQPYELVTPTGAAILATISEKNAPLPLINLIKIGYGAGARTKGKIPNLLRVVIGETQDTDYRQDRILVVEVSIDDANPLTCGHLLEKLYREGALDAYISSIQMKKTRPGVLITVLIPPYLLEKVSSIIFEESPTLGMRYYYAQRYKLPRKSKEVNTKYGKVRVKLGIFKDKVVTVSPEYSDCRRIAERRNIPLRLIYEEVKDCARWSLTQTSHVLRR